MEGLKVNTGSKSEKIYVYELIKNSEIEWIDSATRKRVFTSDGEEEFKLIDIIEHPKTGEPCTICYTPGEGTVYLKEQTNKKSDKKNIGYLKFTGGIAYVKESEKDLKKFLDLSYYSSENPSRPSSRSPKYKLRQQKKIAQAQMDSESTYIEAKAIAWKGGWNGIKTYALAKGINLERDPQEVRHHIAYTIKMENAAEFIRSFSSKETKALALVQEALNLGVIKDDRAAKRIYWPMTQETIFTYMAGESAKQSLGRYLTSPQGEEVRDSLNSKLNSLGQGSDDTPEIMSVDILSYTPKEAVEMAVKNGVLKQGKDECYRFGGTKVGKEIEAIVEHYKSHEENFVKLKEAIVEENKSQK